MSLLHSGGKKNGRVSQVPAQFNDDTGFILRNNVGDDSSLLGANADEEIFIE